MRLKIEGELLQKTHPEKQYYHHGIYSMLIQHFRPETAPERFYLLLMRNGWIFYIW